MGIAVSSKKNKSQARVRLSFVRFDPILDASELKKDVPISDFDLMGIQELRITGCFDRS